MSGLVTGASDKDIDAYMASQGESSSSTLTLPGHLASTPNMTLAEKLALVEDGKKKQMEIGENWFLVAHSWWKRWRKACTGEEDKEGAVTEQDLGPVDNAPLLDPDGNLKQGLIDGLDVEFVPHDVWRCLAIWYGEPLHSLPRRVVPRGAAKEPTLELHPPRFRVLPLARPRCALRSDRPPCKWISLSSGDTMALLCTTLADAVKTPDQTTTPYRIWRVDPNDDGWENYGFPADRVWPARGKVIEESVKTLEEDGLESEDGFVVEFKQTDGWILNDQGMQPQLPTVNLPIFNSSDGFFNKMGSTSSSSKSRSINNSSSLTTPPKSSSSSTSLSNSRNSRSLVPGTLGLSNMGNTCFMNSALQCLVHTKELSDYFLSGVFEDELNADNPLGMGGAIAEAFGSLLHRIWADSGPSTSYSPREFKQVLQKFAPQFSGYQQHDSQELVAFLLDGLHEDLNRILKKPYVEKPDWEGGGNLELVQLAKKSWDGYLLRNDSVIVDLFQGQYQSTLVCPECGKVSITFDPFMYLTLPIPAEKKWSHTIYYIPFDPAQSHLKIPIEINRDASFKDVRNLLGRWLNVEGDNLLTLEIFNHRFYKNLDDSVMVGDMTENDVIVCYGLPCNAQQSRTFKRQPEDPLILPVFLCDAKGAGQWAYSSRVSLFGYPTVVAVSPDEATDVNALYTVVMERLVRYTSHYRDLFNWEFVDGSGTPEIQAKLSSEDVLDVITEIGENGDVVRVEIEEGDIVEEKAMVLDEEDKEPSTETAEPRYVGPKQDVFSLRLQTGHREFGTSSYGANTTHKWEPWERREELLETRGSLLRDGDALFCEFDENKKAYYFGDQFNRFEHARWEDFEEFIHPEYEASVQAAKEKKNKGLSLQDCLDEFTKEEELGEDDLWYCPQCKKHQQATKRFDLWKAPDVLVVHLKRFSNSRTLRDKIDAFIDFPIQDLNLEDMVRERRVAKALQAEGVNIEELNLTNLDEPLIYDLFGVDEHMGGLGGGHYRAYVLNHANEEWYHFDDSFVRPAKAEDAVNADAYLLFYRRRTTKPLGGRLQERISEHKAKAEEHRNSVDTSPPPVEETASPSKLSADNGLPTPPEDSKFTYKSPPPGDLSDRLDDSNGSWTMQSGPSISPLTVSEDPPDFEESLSDPLYMESLNDPMLNDSMDEEFANLNAKRDRISPISDLDPEFMQEEEQVNWDRSIYSNLRSTAGPRVSPSGSENWADNESNLASPSYSNVSSINTNEASQKSYATATEGAEGG
ncbi:hypothetical protein AGABI1DRAFT_118809 [Agaricus bisporus var. burnettii JB137-S8]|uniref:ubiquitinyl hydrolase 1 n=1 Tax=Agaricus bisporus var. burnettii (strain JB137-S8 / ATCC MYA-4627 / FGSC 10392) TaxID=597362 RepID=K5W4J9_AGABU|nr:uncharacterized protein AGABI1DRAFT_118809 [Agaricus bisporus var. burnettii JB137-S8]EKM81724.1 hypothetical protein AGABI1DRAFT_118809 [Agaricus bisporus var. burnettii JB137-S8]